MIINSINSDRKREKGNKDKKTCNKTCIHLVNYNQ